MNKGKKLKEIYDCLKVGDKVSVFKTEEASYSNYAGNPEVLFTPDDVAIVTHVHIPCVRESAAYKGEFVRASFEKSVIANRNRELILVSDWSVAVNYQNIRIIESQE